MDKEQIIKKLQVNAEQIVNNLLPISLNEGQEIKYRNYINALFSTLDLIDRYSWQLKWTKFRDEVGQQHVSIWEQDINGQIRNNKTFAVDEFYKLGGKRHEEELKIITDSVDDKNSNKYLGKKVFNDDSMDEYKITFEIANHYLKNVIKNSKSKLIYVDDNCRNMGKTHSLVELALKYDLPILSDSKLKNDTLQEYAKQIDSSKALKIVCFDFRTVNDNEIYLIDEDMSGKITLNELNIRDILYLAYVNVK